MKWLLTICDYFDKLPLHARHNSGRACIPCATNNYLSVRGLLSKLPWLSVARTYIDVQLVEPLLGMKCVKLFNNLRPSVYL